MRTKARSKATWQVGGRDVGVSNLDKLFWPEQGLAKGDLLEFYRDIAPTLLPYLNDQPFITSGDRRGVDGERRHVYLPRRVALPPCICSDPIAD